MEDLFDELCLEKTMDSKKIDTILEMLGDDKRKRIETQKIELDSFIKKVAIPLKNKINLINPEPNNYEQSYTQGIIKKLFPQ